MEEIKNIPMETLLIGSLYKNPDLYIEFGSLVKSKYDFAEQMNKDLYDWFEVYYKTQSQEINENKFNIFISQDEDKQKKYKKYGGWKSLQSIIELSDDGDIERYFDIVKKYSLLREYSKKGFPAGKIVSKNNFDTMKPEDIVAIFRYNLDSIQTIIGGGKTASVLGKNAVDKLKEWKNKPDIGLEFADWTRYTDQFRGLRKKKIIFDGMLSNAGKSRKLTYIASYFGLIKKVPILVLMNEMDENDILACMITTVLNNKIFGHNIDKVEREIVLGEYKNAIEEKSVFDVAEWVAENTNVFFLEMSSYSDKDLEREIKKYVLGRGVEYIFYDTVKGYKTDNWEGLKQTATLLKDLCNELNIGGYGTIQLTDDTINVKPHEMSSMNIANAKQIKHLADMMTFEKQIDKSEYDKYVIINDFGEIPLDIKKKYYYSRIDKNRAGSKFDIIFEVDLDRNIWKEVGYAGFR